MYMALDEAIGNAKRNPKNVRAMSLPPRGLTLWGMGFEAGDSVC